MTTASTGRLSIRLFCLYHKRNKSNKTGLTDKKLQSKKIGEEAPDTKKVQYKRIGDEAPDKGPLRGLNPGPPAPKAGIIPLDQVDFAHTI